MPKLKKALRHRHQVPLLLSTDITGIFARQPQLFYQLIQTISADCCPIDGVEFLPFRFSYPRVRRSLEKFNIPIVGIHGPMAWNTPDRNLFEKAFVALFAHVMPSVSKAFDLATATKPNYLLFHEPDFNQFYFTQQLHEYLKQDNTPIILLENVYRPHSLQLSVNSAKRLLNQTQAGVMIDLVHLLREVMKMFSSFTNYHYSLNSANIDQYWDKMLWAMDRALEQIPVAALHIPTGTNFDSLPWKLITDEHWQRLAQLLDKHQDRLIALTLENQHLETTLSLNGKHLPAIIKDKKTKIKTLLHNSVL